MSFVAKVDEHHDDHKLLKIVGGIGGGVGLVLICFVIAIPCICYCYTHKRQVRYDPVKSDGSDINSLQHD